MKRLVLVLASPFLAGFAAAQTLRVAPAPVPVFFASPVATPSAPMQPSAPAALVALPAPTPITSAAIQPAPLLAPSANPRSALVRLAAPLPAGSSDGARLSVQRGFYDGSFPARGESPAVAAGPGSARAPRLTARLAVTGAAAFSAAAAPVAQSAAGSPFSHTVWAIGLVAAAFVALTAWVLGGDGGKRGDPRNSRLGLASRPGVTRVDYGFRSVRDEMPPDLSMDVMTLYFSDPEALRADDALGPNVVFGEDGLIYRVERRLDD